MWAFQHPHRVSPYAMRCYSSSNHTLKECDSWSKRWDSCYEAEPLQIEILVVKFCRGSAQNCEWGTPKRFSIHQKWPPMLIQPPTSSSDPFITPHPKHPFSCGYRKNQMIFFSKFLLRSWARNLTKHCRVMTPMP